MKKNYLLVFMFVTLLPVVAGASGGLKISCDKNTYYMMKKGQGWIGLVNRYDTVVTKISEDVLDDCIKSDFNWDGIIVGGARGLGNAAETFKTDVAGDGPAQVAFNCFCKINFNVLEGCTVLFPGCHVSNDPSDSINGAPVVQI
ncbi:MAG: hypothetical protein V1647_02455, partial [Pseudomonadota bacterium]